MHFDMFGLNYECLLNRDAKTKNSTGGYFTILYFLIVIGLFFGFGMDFYTKKNPIVIYYKMVGEYEKVYQSNDNAIKTYSFLYG